MAIKTGYAAIKNNIETIIESNIPQLSKEYRDLIVDSIMTSLRDSGLKPHTWTPSYITDIDEVKDWNICGFRAEELVLLACNLRENGVDDIRLQDYNKAFKDGYMSAVKEFNEGLERSIKKIMGEGF